MSFLLVSYLFFYIPNQMLAISQRALPSGPIFTNIFILFMTILMQNVYLFNFLDHPPYVEHLSIWNFTLE
jgi:hypothetical protein